MAGTRARLTVVIAGAGAPGLALGTALARALVPRFAVIVCDPVLDRDPPADDRVSAIAGGTRRLLAVLGAWQRFEASAQPIVEMEITDSRLEDAVRPTFLSFDATRQEGEPLAHMVENRSVLLALRATAKEAGVEFVASGVENFSAETDFVEVQTRGDRFHAQLLAAADGPQSRLRELAGIKSVSWTYGQSGIVATIGHERDHRGRAVQHFLAGGPFAILPLTGRRSSIVWTEATSEADRIARLESKEFHGELERRFGLKLGEIEVLSPPRVHPLGFSVARSFVADRLALLGDAAHLIHPIAGQGLNLGLRDVAALAESVVEAARLGLDVGSADVLARYERWRRFDTAAMGFTTDSLNRLFSNRSDALRLLRDVGLGIVERAPRLKEFLSAEAGGSTGAVPKLLRGEAL
jgi:2-octaprenyl-6-methoxyphenol hydroxylase